MARETIVFALGGNAITREFEEGLIEQQFANVRHSLAGVLQLLKEGHKVVITHGNGPQVGNALIRVEEARQVVPPLPLGVIVADLQGGMGYMIEQCLQNLLKKAALDKDVVTIVTQVLVDPDDPSIQEPTKFVGPFFQLNQVHELEEKRGWIVKEDVGRGFRRVVPSPMPKGVVEKNILKKLIADDTVVIAGGGGGIPVYYDDRGWLEGVDGVIDKDLASALIGNEIGASRLIILTGVDKVAVHYRTKDQKDLDTITVQQARDYFKQGEFPKGSMGPKIEAAINFIENGGKEVLITSIDAVLEALQGKNGTRVIP